MKEKIKINGSYQTRGGKPVRVLCVDRRNTDEPVVALIGEHENPKTFTENGCFHNDSVDSEYDLFPAPRNFSAHLPYYEWMAMDEDGSWRLYTKKPWISELQWCAGDGRGFYGPDIPPAPDWRESLIHLDRNGVEIIDVKEATKKEAGE